MDKQIVDIDDVAGKLKKKYIVSALIRAFDALEAGNFKQVIEITKDLLKTDRKIPQAHYLVARVTIETKQLGVALKAIEAAIELDASISEYWAFLALVHSQSGSMVKAETAVMMALKISTDKANVLHVIAHVLSVLGRFKEAISHLKKATDISPDNGTYHRALGVSLLEIGDFNSAKQSLKNAIAVNENDAESWWVLSSLIKAKDNNMAYELINIMKKIEAYPRPFAHLGYAAGKLFEDTECWDEAFEAFERGATNKRRIVDYDRHQAKNTFETLKKICTNDWLYSSFDKVNESSPIFIIGQPRTGTTLIDRIISSHSLVHSAGEPLQLAMSLRAITGSRTKEFISAELINKAKNVTGEELAKSYLSGLANLRGDTPYFIDKFPMNFMLVGFIVKAFPKAKIIHVTRNPVDTCLAVFKQLFEDVYQHSYDQCEMAEHYVMYSNLMEHWHAIMPGKIFDIAYEDVVIDHDTQARRLIKHLELDWEDACTNFEKNSVAVATASAVQVREKVHSRSVGRWMKYEKHLLPTLAILKAADIKF
jgi:tetratricopeptide (TPR) repeat protein